jgi:hypothetical protein
VAAGLSVNPARWREQFDELMERIAGRFARVEPRRRARAFVLGLLSGLRRKNCWTIAEQAGDAVPDGMQHLLAAARWDADAVRDDLRGYVTEQLASADAVLVVDETGDVKKGRASPAFSCPVSSIAPITIPPRRRAAVSRPLAANRRTTLIAAKVSQLAWFSSRCVRSGVRSRPCRAILHPFTLGSSLTSADTYLSACSHGSVRAKHGRSSPSSSFCFRTASPAPILTAAAASDLVLVTQA